MNKLLALVPLLVLSTLHVAAQDPLVPPAAVDGVPAAPEGNTAGRPAHLAREVLSDDDDAGSCPNAYFTSSTYASRRVVSLADCHLASNRMYLREDQHAAIYCTVPEGATLHYDWASVVDDTDEIQSALLPAAEYDAWVEHVDDDDMFTKTQCQEPQAHCVRDKPSAHGTVTNLRADKYAFVLINDNGRENSCLRFSIYFEFTDPRDASAMDAINVMAGLLPTQRALDPCMKDSIHVRCVQDAPGNMRIQQLLLSGRRLDIGPESTVNLHSMSMLEHVHADKTFWPGRMPQLPSSIKTAIFSSCRFTSLEPQRTLPFLEILNIAHNPLSASSWLHHVSGENAPSLKEFNAFGAKLTGALPSWSTVLEFLDLRGADVSGNLHVPPTMKEIFVSDNAGISGALPNFRTMGNLITVDAGGCSFREKIPEIGNCPHLIEFDVSSNDLSGDMPLISSNKKLVYFNVSHNHLEGPVHSELPPNLQYYSIARNTIAGEVVESSCTHLENVKHWDVHANNLTGALSELSCFQSSRKEWFYSENMFSCPLPPSCSTRECGPCNPLQPLLRMFRLGVSYYLAGQREKARQSLVLAATTTYTGEADLIGLGGPQTVRRLAEQFVHNLDLGMDLYGVAENSVSVLAWGAYDMLAMDAISALGKAEEKLEHLNEQLRTGAVTMALLRDVEDAVLEQASNWDERLAILSETLSFLDQELMFLRRSMDAEMMTLEQGIRLVQEQIGHNVQKIDHEIKDMGKLELTKLVKDTVHLTTALVSSVIGVPSMSKTVVNVLNVAGDVMSMLDDTHEEKLEAVEDALIDSIEALDTVLESFYSVDRMVQQLNTSGTLKEILPPMRVALHTVNELEQALTLYSEYLKGSSEFDHMLTDVNEFISMIKHYMRQIVAWYALHQRQQSMEGQRATLLSTVSQMEELARRKSGVMASLEVSSVALEFARGAAAFRAASVLQDEIRQLDYVSLRREHLMLDVDEDADHFVTSAQLQDQLNHVHERRKSFLSATTRTSVLFANFTVTRKTHASDFDQLLRSGNITFDVAIPPPGLTNLHHVQMESLGVEIDGITSDSKIAMDVTHHGQSLFYDENRELFSFVHNATTFAVDWDTQRQCISEFSRFDPNYVNLSPYGVWTVSINKAGQYDLTNVRSISLMFKLSVKRQAKEDDGELFGNKYPYSGEVRSGSVCAGGSLGAVDRGTANGQVAGSATMRGRTPMAVQ